ncbi:MAG: uracil phosphoribosyltransferase, partial [Bdellovibrionales bacterium]|nr:uracil phosphoribosyltransferase [Bdellovibrionales bacterium]
IVTPEFIKKVIETHPDVHIYAVRVDRGFSSEEALKATPGQLWDREKGLNENDYIVPGAGGVGELINNSFV